MSAVQKEYIVNHQNTARKINMQSTDKKLRNETWTINKKDESVTNPILLEGLPGVGNVGKVIVDYLIEELEAEKYASFFSYTMPNSVFVTENNKVNLPTIDLYKKDINGQTYLFLTGDVQPTNEKGSYTFSETILEMLDEQGCEKIITLGGIGLKEQPDNPDVYCTGNNDELIKQCEEAGAKTEIYGKVGPIIGITGLLIGLSDERNINSVALLTETRSHPIQLGLEASKATFSILQNILDIDITVEDMAEKIQDMKDDMEKEKKKQSKQSDNVINETGYIG